MLQIAICDDNRADGQMMKTLLSESLQIMGEPGCCHIFQNGKALEYEVEDGQDFDLLFLDIELGMRTDFCWQSGCRAVFRRHFLFLFLPMKSMSTILLNYSPFGFCPKDA